MSTEAILWAMFVVAPLLAVLGCIINRMGNENEARFFAETGLGLTPELQAYIDRKRKTADCLIGY
jgi:hypothetical protein